MSPQLPPEILSEIVAYLLDAIIRDASISILAEYERAEAIFSGNWGSGTLPVIKRSKISLERRIARLATVSRAWQIHVEEVTFGHLSLNYERAVRARQQGILCPRRQACVRRIDFTIPVPLLRPSARFLTDGYLFSKRFRDEQFTRSVRKSFSALANLFTAPDLDVWLKLSVLTDHTRLKGEGHFPRWAQPVSPCHEILDLVCNNERIPTLNMVTGFGVHFHHAWCRAGTSTCGGRKLLASIRCRLASRMPRLESIDWQFAGGNPSDGQRNDLAESLPLLPPSVKEVQINFGTDRDPELGGLVPFHGRLPLNPFDDKLTLAFHSLSQRLVKLHLTGTMSEGVLWPYPTSNPKTMPYWPRLQALRLDLSPVYPSGLSMLEELPTSSFLPPPSGPGGYESGSEDDEDELDESDHTEDDGDWYMPSRLRVKPEVVEHLLMAAARAARRMPALRILFIRIDEEGVDFRMGYDAELRLLWTGGMEGDRNRYEPSGKLAEAWRAVVTGEDIA